MTSSYSPELNFDARKPRFHGDPATLFEDGVVPDGWMTTNPAEAEDAAADTSAKGVTINNPGEGFEDGSPTGVATTALTGGGSGATVDLEISSGQVQAASVTEGAAGSGYAQGDTLSVTGYEGVVLGVTVTSD
tara:strand:+ start:817 stop:1215 length:399 start_codon:yes stop_codon:yes gene_type:complete